MKVGRLWGLYRISIGKEIDWWTAGKHKCGSGSPAKLKWHYYMVRCSVSHSYLKLAKMAEPSESEFHTVVFHTVSLSSVWGVDRGVCQAARVLGPDFWFGFPPWAERKLSWDKPVLKVLLKVSWFGGKPNKQNVPWFLVLQFSRSCLDSAIQGFYLCLSVSKLVCYCYNNCM